jgi:hypothetical protein
MPSDSFLLYLPRQFLYSFETNRGYLMSKLTNRIAIKLTTENLKDIDNLSNRIGCTRSNFIRMAIAFFMKNWEGN